LIPSTLDLAICLPPDEPGSGPLFFFRDFSVDFVGAAFFHLTRWLSLPLLNSPIYFPPFNGRPPPGG